ncbi:terpene synthase 10-like [Ipomoea triloba]|uniref:terpene synthase 10-like n=1 Tax=Ipomoea triloba TaxID=35885 RepID=UPI00125CE63E|nr:terpene synthase 10-like [Ipomoea triloba]
MASIANVLPSFTHKLPFRPRSHNSSFRMSYQTTTTTTRKSANYPPPTWDFNFIQTLNTNSYAGEKFVTRRDELKEEVKDLLNNGEIKEAEKIEMIDQLQKLDCSYHFEDEINAALMDIYTKKSSNNFKSSEEKDLYSTALEFRVLRQNGFDISPEVFEGFMDGKRLSFNANLGEDTKGLLNLYEASFLSKEEDTILELARDFSAKHLKQVINGDQNLNDPKLLPHVQRALDIPLHWRAPRLESRFLIDSFDLGKTSSNDSTLLDLAKLDFNIAQAVYLEDLRSVSRWWKDSCITEKLEFVRDKVVENFIWALSKTSSPKYSHCRRVVTKIDVLLCTVDDLYDIYGTLDELQLFTETIERWDDITQVGHLPEKMQFCYFAVHNFANEVAYDILKEHNVNILPYLRREWVALCKSHLQEAKWAHSGVTPPYEDYIENAWVSIGCNLALMHAFVHVNHPLKESDLQCNTKYHEIVRLSSILLRLPNDKGTSSYEMKRGDVPKAIQCYANEHKVSCEEARDFVDGHINETWNKINKFLFDDTFTKTFVQVTMNIGRVALCMYQHGDGHSFKNLETNRRIQAALFDPIPLII